MKYATQKLKYFGKNNPFYGKKHTPETKAKISLSRIGKPTIKGENHWNWKGGKWKKLLTERKPCPICGKPIWLKSNFCKSCRQKGERHFNWKGGITKERIKIWRSKEYKQWRKAVFERDKYTCQACGKTNCWIEAHHIKPFSNFPELRFDVSNGITFCRSCHYKIRHHYKRPNSFNTNSLSSLVKSSRNTT